MIVAAPIQKDETSNPTIDPRWGRANWIALAEVSGGKIVGWNEKEVLWDKLHDEGTDGAHHARIAKFIKENQVEMIVVDHMGDGMVRMLKTMEIPVIFGASGSARAAIENATTLTAPKTLPLA